MITALKNKIDRLTDEGMTLDKEMDMDMEKISECQRHLTFLPAQTAKDIHSKLSICTMMGLSESDLTREYLDAWAANDFTFINANNDQALMQLKQDASHHSLADDEWNALYYSVVTDINKFICEEIA